jgi:type I restriction enzyme R subunit
MLGRATRLCPEIGKEMFRIYDAVDLYAALQPYTAMKPVVTRPSIPFAQLATELANVPDPVHQQSVIDEFVGKLQAKRRRIQGEHLQAFADVAGMSPADLVGLLRQRDVAKARAFFADHPGVAEFLDRLQIREGRVLLVSEHQDEFLGSERGYGTATRPEDYLASFRAYLEQNKNVVDALIIVTQRPRDLTRKQLRELKLQLDSAGYPESALRTASAQVSNQDIAASIIGFIRQQALGSPLLPYDQRVDRALQRVLGSQAWTQPQRQWLERIAKQVKVEVVVDRDALERGEFKTYGGFARLNRVFDGKLEQVLGTLHEELWRDVA